MAEVIPFKRPEDPHMTGEARCMKCGREWVAAAPIGTEWLECPGCGTMHGTFKQPIERDGAHWVCKCGNELFRVTPDGYYCPACGEWQHGF